jgi:hypothetical protein
MTRSRSNRKSNRAGGNRRAEIATAIVLAAGAAGAAVGVGALVAAGTTAIVGAAVE